MWVLIVICQAGDEASHISSHRFTTLKAAEEAAEWFNQKCVGVDTTIIDDSP